MTIRSTQQDRMIGIWLISCAVVVWALIVVGGLTRLTRSGLSITQWRPIAGVLPPLNAGEWAEAFDQYQHTPEYRLVNDGMSLEAFRAIYFVEYLHRLLARAGGLAFALPLAVFTIQKRIGRRWRILLAISGLAGLQGVAGWWMVSSGLVDVPHVSPYRLAVHLMIALGVIAPLLWFGLEEIKTSSRSPCSFSRSGCWAVSALLGLSALAVLSGAVMAGMRAGYASNTFPTMNGDWIPAALGAVGWYPDDLLKDPVSVHFLHRAFGTVAAVAALASAPLLWRCRVRRARTGAVFILMVVAIQITLGALTVLGSVPVHWASLHQANAVLLLIGEFVILHDLSLSMRAQGRVQPTGIFPGLLATHSPLRLSHSPTERDKHDTENNA